MADNDGGTNSPAEIKAGAAPVDANHRQSRPSSVNKGRPRPKSMGPTLHWFACVGQDPEFEPDYFDNESARGEGAGREAQSREREEREERARAARERQHGERQRKLEELRAQALAAQRFREQKEEERRRRIDEMRVRDTDRRHQVEERKRAIWEAERERREAIVRRNEERDARLEGRRRGAGQAGVFAFGSSTPRMLEPADTGGTFWGHRRATSTSNVMFAALPLSRRSSERELDPNKKRATSAGGLDRQPGDDFRISTTMYDVFNWTESGGTDAGIRPTPVYSQQGYYEEAGADGAPWSRVARRRTDLVPTLPAHRDSPRAPRSPGRAFSMTRLDQLARPRAPRPAPAPAPLVASPLVAPPPRPPRHRSMGNLAASRATPSHRSMSNLAGSGPSPPPRKHSRPPQASQPSQPASGVRSGEVTPGSPSRPGSALSAASVAAMTSSVTGVAAVSRRPRAAPRRPRPASIAGTGVTTPPHVKNSAVGTDGKPIGVRAEKPPLPRVHSAGTPSKRAVPPSANPADKPEPPRRTHKSSSVKASPRVTPRATPLQSPANDYPPSSIQEVLEAASLDTFMETSSESITLSQSQVIETVPTENSNGESNMSTVTETVTQVTKDPEGEKETQVLTNTVTNGGPVPVHQTITETVSNISEDKPSVAVKPEGFDKLSEDSILETVKNIKNDEDVISVVKEDADIQEVVAVACDDKPKMPVKSNGIKKTAEEPLIDAVKNLKIKEEVSNPKSEPKPQETAQAAVDPLDGADMTGSMMARRGQITTEGEAKAALAERRKFAREEAERQAEKERLRLEREAEEELERQRQEDERQRRLEEETLRLSELQRRAEDERLQQAILDAERLKEEETQRRESEARARAEREVAEARAREEAERQRRETAKRLQREEEEREARRKRVEAIMLRTRQAKKKDGDKSPTEENKSLDDAEQKSEIESKIMNMETSQQDLILESQSVDNEAAYEQSVREREEALFNHLAQPAAAVIPQTFAPKQEAEVSGNGMNPFHNGTAPSNGDSQEHPVSAADLSQSNNYSVQNGHSKNQINELNNFINTSENQFNNMALDNAVKQHNVTNNLLDISDLDILNTANSNNPFLIDVNTNGSTVTQPLSNQHEGSAVSQMLDLSVDTIAKNLVNEDSVNSNQTNNSPFITSFQDNQENRDVSLL